MQKDVITTKLETLINAVIADDPIDFEARKVEVAKRDGRYEAIIDQAGIALQYMVQVHRYLEKAGLVDHSRNPRYEGNQIVTDEGRYYLASPTEPAQMSEHIRATSSQGEMGTKLFPDKTSTVQMYPYQGSDGIEDDGTQQPPIPLHFHNFNIEVGFGNRSDDEISCGLDAAIRWQQIDPMRKKRGTGQSHNSGSDGAHLN